MPGQFTMLSDNLALGNAHACALHTKPGVTGTLHITTPGEGMCQQARGVGVEFRHGSFHKCGNDDWVLGWEEYAKPLTHEMLEQCVWWYRGIVDSGGRGLVHCHAGLHRSPTIAIALLCKVEGMDFFSSTPHLIRRMQRYEVPHFPLFEGEDLRTVHGWLGASVTEF